MKRSLIQEIEIPEGINVNVLGALIKVGGPSGEVQRELKLDKVAMEKKDNKIILFHKNASKKEKKIINTLTAHIKNLIIGAGKKFEYELKICYGHFPMTIEINGNKAIIKNFLGEKKARSVNIPDGAEVKISKEIITVSSINKEIAGQASANFETATRIRGRDKRVFQDGVYITKKNGKEL